MDNKKTQLVMFDFDGVIVDSLQISYDSMKSVNDNPPSLEVYQSYFNGNIYEQLEEMEDEESTVSSDDPFFKSYIPKLLALDPIKGMREVIEYLHDNGSRKVIIVSSTINSPIAEWIQQHGLDTYFDKIYGADVHKSKIKKMRMALDEYSVKESDALFITDTLGDIREANKVGIPSIAVSWGFQNKETLAEGSPKEIVDSPDQLLEAVKVL